MSTQTMSSVRKRLFPMHLTAFENYMLADERQKYPMAFVVEFKFSGDLKRDEFESAIDSALERHQIFQAIIRPAKQNRDCWVDAKGQKPFISWGNIDDPVECPGGEIINIREEVGLRIWVRRDQEHAVVTAQFHHAACDGIGAYQFLGDVLWYYAKSMGEEELEPLPEFEPNVLRNRGRASVSGNEFFDEKGNFILNWREIRRMYFGRTTELKKNRKSNVESTAPFPGILSFTIDKKEYRQIRLAAQDLAQTPNDYLLEKLFVAMKHWNQEHRIFPWPQALAVNLPLDLRTEDTLLPATNVVTIHMVRRSGKKLNDPQMLVDSLREEISSLKRDRHRSSFMNLITAAQAKPTLLKKWMSAEKCLATAVLSNTGDPTKQFYVQLPRESGVIRCGNLMLDEVAGVPPLRPKTRASISIFTYQRKLKICVRCDPHFFSSVDTQQFLDLYVKTIRDGVAKQDAANSLN